MSDEEWKKPWWLEYAGAAGVAVAFVALLWNGWNTRQQLALTTQSLELAQRAWVLVERHEWPKDFTGFQPNTEITVKFHWRNTGSGPARYVEVNGFALVREAGAVFPDNPQYLPLRAAGSKVIIGPADTVTSFAPVRAMSDDEIARIEAGTLVLYVYGYALYRDVFDEQRWTTYCTMFEPRTKILVLCDKYNDTDSPSRPVYSPNFVAGRWEGKQFVFAPTPPPRSK